MTLAQSPRNRRRSGTEPDARYDSAVGCETTPLWNRRPGGIARPDVHAAVRMPPLQCLRGRGCPCLMACMTTRHAVKTRHA